MNLPVGTTLYLFGTVIIDGRHRIVRDTREVIGNGRGTRVLVGNEVMASEPTFPANRRGFIAAMERTAELNIAESDRLALNREVA